MCLSGSNIAGSFSGNNSPQQQIQSSNCTNNQLKKENGNFSHENNNTQKLKTNASGKWQSLLKPGNYRVHILKINNETKQKSEITQDIIVPNISGTLQLPVSVIKRWKKMVTP